jgi:1,4-alpha-glucan branching enzyme
MLPPMRTLAVLGALDLLLACGSSARRGGEQPDAGPSRDAAAPADAGSAHEGADATPEPELDAGLGATVHPGGVTFRVWAPEAASVFVEGDFDGWSPTADALAPEGDGTFGGDVAGATVGQAYAYAITSADGTVVTRIDPRARQITSSHGHGIIVDGRGYAWQTSDFVPPDPLDTIIYELHLGTFNRASPSTQGGWSDAAQKLDYLAALGVNAVEIMPPAACGSASSWGYDPAWPFALQVAYGTPDDARAFIDAAHARGIAVLIDVVHNHYVARPGLGCWDGPCDGYEGAYFYTDPTLRTTIWGPRPDFATDQVRAFIRDAAEMWLGSEYRADGLRWDSTISIRATTWGPSGVPIPEGASLLTLVNDAAHAFPNKLEIAEDLQADPSVTSPTSAGGLGFDAQWDASFVNPVDAALIAGSDGDRDMTQIASAITSSYDGSAAERVIFTDDHDEDAQARLPQLISPSDPGSLGARQLSTLGASLLMTTPGVPMILMGQEFLEDGAFSDTNPLDWSKTTTYAGILALYTDLIHLRREVPSLLTGNVSVISVNNGAKVIAFRRWSQADEVVVVVNLSGTAFPEYDLGLPAAGTWRVRFSSNDKTYSPDFPGTPTADVVTIATPRDGFAQMGKLVLGPYQALILSPR